VYIIKVKAIPHILPRMYAVDFELRPGGQRATVIMLAAAPEAALERAFQVFLEYLRNGRQGHVREIECASGPMGRMFVTIVGCITELERSLIVERIKAGMRRRKLEGFRLGRLPLDVDRAAVLLDRLSGSSLTATAKKHGVSRASVVRFVREAQRRSAPLERFRPMSAGAPVQLTA
jgi:hypothetical protein